MTTGISGAEVTAALGRPVEELSDSELEIQGKQAHDTRNWVFLHGTTEQFANHTRRMLALEEEYLRRHPKRTWQGHDDSTQPRGDDPVRALLQMVDAEGGRMHKLELHQAARECGVARETLASLYGASGYLAADRSDRILTDAGRAAARGGDDSARRNTPDLRWVHEQNPVWDPDRDRIIGQAPAAVFDFSSAQDGDPMTGEWWRAEDVQGVVGYGWMDSAWGDAEVLLAVEPHRQTHGVGSFVLDHLESEAAARGVNYVYNTVRGDRAYRARLRRWLIGRGYVADPDSDVLRKRVGGRVIRESGRAAYAPVFDPAGDRGPGAEESGGYVDPEFHQY